MKRRFLCVFMVCVWMLAMLPITAHAEEESPVFKGTLSTSERGIALLESLEGYVETPKSDYGQNSIGYGCSTEYAAQFGFSTTSLSKDEAHELLLFVLDEMETKLDAFLKNNGITVNQYQYDALMSFTYNLGSDWMKSSSQNRLRELLVNGRYTVNEFASAMGVYCHVTNANGEAEVLDHLVTRRIQEIKLFLYGAYALTDVPEKFCTLRYSAEEGNPQTDITFHLVGQPYQTLADAENSGKYFAGWYTAGGWQLTAYDTVAESQVVYAVWSDEPADAMTYCGGDLYISSPTPQVTTRDYSNGSTTSNPSSPDYQEAAEVFSDLYSNQWYYSYVNDLYNEGIINGYEDATFRPERTVTTGEALKMILLAAGYEEPEQVTSHWASGYHYLALDEEILERGDITDLDVPISRAMMAKIAANALQLERMYDIDVFADTADLYASILADHSIIEGYEDGTFRPDRSLTRAELSTIVWRMNHLFSGI